MKIGFDNQKYLELQSRHIMEKLALFGDKLYLEFGGKLFDDFHAARVLPGFEPDSKIKMLQEVADLLEVIIVINAGDIERKKIRADYGITYDMDVMRLMDALRARDIYVNSVVIKQYKDQPSADIFRKKLMGHGEKVYIHKNVTGYPNDVDTIVSDEGYGVNPYIETSRKIIIVTAPGPGSGKLATCLSQLYHESKMGVRSGYAKFETFPIWNLPLKHPVNIAYEAATADLRDVNMIDPFHLEAYGTATVNYNRDIEVFPIVQNILNKILPEKKDLYKSPTDMGVNMAGYCVSDDEAVREAARQEIIRRYYRCWCDYKNGRGDIEAVHKLELLLNDLSIKPQSRTVVIPALEKAKCKSAPACAIELGDGRIVTGKTTSLMNAPACAIINSLKVLSSMDDEIHLISPLVFEPIMTLKKDILGGTCARLGVEEVLMALSISAVTNPMASHAVSKLPLLSGCEAHTTTMPSDSDEATLRRLGMNITSEPEFENKELYQI